MSLRLSSLVLGLTLGAYDSAALAQEMPAEYASVMTALGKKGDYKDGVLKVNIPRTDLEVTIHERPVPTSLGFGGWVAMAKGDGGHDVLMGDLVLTEDEVNPVMSALLDNGLEVSALHNHFFWEQPRIFYMHVHGVGAAADLATRLKPALTIIDKAMAGAPTKSAPAPHTAGELTTKTLASIIGHEGEHSGRVYKITIGRPDIALREHGDVAMLAHEVTPVLKALRSNGLDIVAIHHHMTGTEPTVYFLHYLGTGPAERLARGVRAAVDVLGKPRPTAH